MIRFETNLGRVEISQEYFANLIGRAASECYGVAGMLSSPYQSVRSRLLRRVRSVNGGLTVDIHIAVTYGVNISAIVRSIIHKVRYTVEESTGFPVAKVNVYVDSMKAQ